MMTLEPELTVQYFQCCEFFNRTLHFCPFLAIIVSEFQILQKKKKVSVPEQSLLSFSVMCHQLNKLDTDILDDALQDPWCCSQLERPHFSKIPGL